MSRPTYTVSNENFRIEVPAGWTSIITAISRRSYMQAVSITNSLLPTSEIFLRNKPGKLNEAMETTNDHSTSVLTDAQAKSATLGLNFYYVDPDNTPRRARRAKAMSNSNKIVTLAFSTPPNSPQESADYTTFVVYVQNHPDNEEHSFSADTIATVHLSNTTAQSEPLASPPTFNLRNIQGDIVPGLPKAFEYFYFFRIADINLFRQATKTFVLPNITTADKVLSSALPPPGYPKLGTEFIGFNVGFSPTGLSNLGLVESLHDEAFSKGQLRDSKDLGDRGIEKNGSFLPDWDPEFRTDIHGVFLITAHDNDKARAFVQSLNTAFSEGQDSAAIHKVLLFHSHFRPHPETLNEHFGYRDGIAKPEIEGVTFNDQKPMRFPGSPIVDLGLIVMGHSGDEDKDLRPPWAVDGSFLVFRKLKCFVPEFNKFVLEEGGKMFPDLPPQDAADKLGARMFGRWKSGTPVVLSPDKDDLNIAKDDSRLNNFDYHSADQETCPFAAHTRKSFPRSDLATSKRHLFRRQSITYGPEVGPGEERTTIKDRGLVFIAYQSSIVRGFKYIQQSFSNTTFPQNKSAEPGHDPILGSTGREQDSDFRYMSGANPSAQTDKLIFPVQFIHVDGGEYFFVPSVSTLSTRIAL